MYVVKSLVIPYISEFFRKKQRMKTEAVQPDKGGYWQVVEKKD